MDEPARRPGIAPEAGVLALVAAASVPVDRLFHAAEPGQMSLGAVQFGTLITAALVAWGLRRLRIPGILAALLSGAAFIWFAAAVFEPHALAGPFPTPHAIASLLSTMREGLRASATDAAPVAPTAGFLSLFALGIWATLWLVDDAAVRLRHPLLAIGLALPMFAMPGTLIRGPRIAVDVAFFGAAALVVLLLDERARLSRWAGRRSGVWRPGLAGRIGVAAIVLGLAAAPLLPGYGQTPGGSVRSGTGGGRLTVNPFVAVRPSLNETPISQLFTVKSNQALYWRLTALDRYDGSTWTATPEAATLTLARPVRPTSPAPTLTPVVQRITIQNLAGPWIPSAFEPVSVKGITGARMQPTTRTMLIPNGFRTGQVITVVSDVPAVTAEELDADVASSPDEARYLELPSDTPPSIVALAQRVTSGGQTRLEKAVLLQDYLRTFTYDETVALRHSFSDLETFLLDPIRGHRGYCEQFAASMAVMARALGIPARVAVGFGTGAPIAPDEYEVTSREAHAWVEILFPGYGWLPFEPTPRTNGFSVPPYAQIPAPSNTPGASASPSSAAATPTPTPATSARPDLLRGETGAGTKRAAVHLPWGWIAVAAAAALALAAIPGAALAHRLLRRRGARTPAEVVEVRYAEFLEWCRATALGRFPGETPLEHARRLTRHAETSSSDAVSALARLATQAVYGGDGGAVEAAAVISGTRRARTALKPAVSRWRRAVPFAGWAWWRSPYVDGQRARTRRRRPPLSSTRSDSTERSVRTN
jgi:transglutaminase-like putative cysteine protease